MSSDHAAPAAVGLLDQDDVFFTHLHLTGASWDEPVRHSFESRVAALAEHGCTAMGMGQEELAQLLETRKADELRAVLDGHGVRIGELEILFGWDAPAELKEQADAMEHGLLMAAEQVGARRFKASCYYPTGVELPPVEYLAERFAALCDRAAERGLQVALESIAINPGFTYTVAADVVTLADRPNGGLLIDTWHLFRDPTGAEALEKIAGRHVIGIELSDAPAELKGSLNDECTNGRLLPGVGGFDLVGLLRTLDAKGTKVQLAVEVLSAEMREISPSENVARSLTAVRSLLKAARSA